MLRTWEIELARQKMELPETAMQKIAVEIATDQFKKFQCDDSEAFDIDKKIAELETLREIYPNLAIVLDVEVPVMIWDLIGNSLTPVGKNMAIKAMIDTKHFLLLDWRNHRVGSVAS